MAVAVVVCVQLCDSVERVHSSVLNIERKILADRNTGGNYSSRSFSRR